MKEFDIYLRERLTECDILVYSIPFRDGITAFNRLVLESCIESYLLQKFVAAQTGSELVPHIDKMIKTCCEMLDCNATIGASAEFSTHYTAYPMAQAVEVGCSDVQMLETTFERAENALQIALEPLLVLTGKSPGRGSSKIEISQSVKDTLKTSVENFSAGLQIHSEVSGSSKRSFESATPSVEPYAEIANLCYRVYRSGETAFQIAASVREIELHYSLGGGASDILVDCSVENGDIAIKYEQAKSALNILTDLTESIRQYMAPSHAAVCVSAQASSYLKRYRKLSEIDGGTLASIDDMTLEELDYVILS